MALIFASDVCCAANCSENVFIK
uniref:Uncharacterized protein n=1 Tax=Rhizophora mucronata TaxID=61149 RepID=A0A2P2QW17_RHIMU